MTNILEEVQDDAAYIGKVNTFKKILFISVFGIIIFVVVMLFYSSRNDAQMLENRKISTILLEMQENPSDEQIAALKTALIDQDTALSTVALLEIVGLNLEHKDYKEAANNLRTIINSTKTNDIVKSHAVITLVSIAVDYEDIVDQELLNKCLDYLGDDKIPFNSNAKITKSLYLIKQGNKVEAEKLLKSVINTNNVAKFIKTQALATLAAITTYDQDK